MRSGLVSSLTGLIQSGQHLIHHPWLLSGNGSRELIFFVVPNIILNPLVQQTVTHRIETRLAFIPALFAVFRIAFARLLIPVIHAAMSGVLRLGLE
jgi:hypothetical protein